MIDWIVLPALLQLSAAPAEFYQPEVSEEVRAIIEERRTAPQPDQLEELDRLSRQDDDSATELLGELYLLALMRTDRNPERGCAYFVQLEGRRPDGLHNLATCYLNGDGVAQDLAKSRQLYRQAAEGGWRMAYCAYGNMLVRGEGGDKDVAEGLRLCRMTAVAGDRDAQTDYGGYLLTGVGGERDPVTARFMLEQAAAQEQRNAAFLLAQIHHKGDGVEKSLFLSQQWYERAYAWGRRDAAFEVALQLMRRGYSDGDDGMRVSSELLSEAVTWLERAAEQDPAAERREEARAIIPQVETLIEAAS